MTLLRLCDVHSPHGEPTVPAEVLNPRVERGEAGYREPAQQLKTKTSPARPNDVPGMFILRLFYQKRQPLAGGSCTLAVRRLRPGRGCRPHRLVEGGLAVVRGALRCAPAPDSGQQAAWSRPGVSKVLQLHRAERIHPRPGQLRRCADGLGYGVVQHPLVRPGICVRGEKVPCFGGITRWRCNPRPARAGISCCPAHRRSPIKVPGRLPGCTSFVKLAQGQQQAAEHLLVQSARVWLLVPRSALWCPG